jgi:hypothetical protein
MGYSYDEWIAEMLDYARALDADLIRHMEAMRDADAKELLEAYERFRDRELEQAIQAARDEEARWLLATEPPRPFDA